MEMKLKCCQMEGAQFFKKLCGNICFRDKRFDKGIRSWVVGFTMQLWEKKIENRGGFDTLNSVCSATILIQNKHRWFND